MNTFRIIITCTVFILTCFTNAHAVSTFGAYARGNDLLPVHAFLEDGGMGSSFASVSFTTFAVESGFDPSSTYLPILKARSEGLDATFDDDRTNTSAEAYQVFTSSITQTIRLDIQLDSTVTNDVGGTSGVLSNIYLFGGPNFAVQDSFCRGGEFTFDGIYLCGDKIATSSRNGLNWSNLYNGGSDPLLTDSLTFTVQEGESFGIYAELTAGSYMGTADAFNTLTMGFDNDEFIDVANIPGVPLPASAWLFVTGLLGIFGLGRKLKAVKRV